MKMQLKYIKKLFKGVKNERVLWKDFKNQFERADI